MRGVDLSDFQRGMIYGLKFHAHWTNSQIALATHCSLAAVKKYCQRAVFKEMEGEAVTTARKGRCGRHKVINERGQRAIARSSDRDPFKTAVEINSELRAIMLYSSRTTQRSLKMIGLRAHSPAKKTLLTQHHKAARLNWSIIYLHWDENQWHNIIFSDESKFVIGKYHSRYVRRRIGQRYEDRFVEKGVNRGRGEVMVWGGFSYFGFSPLIRVPGRLNSEGYTDLLHHALLPILNALLPNGGLFQQDNAPIHAAANTLQWLQDNNVNVMPWPALSPDMNPIEQVWGILSKEIQAAEINNSGELFTSLSNCWNGKMADQQFRATYISSMVKRVRALHIARGSYTRY
jgi:hypothetical protein